MCVTPLVPKLGTSIAAVSHGAVAFFFSFFFFFFFLFHFPTDRVAMAASALDAIFARIDALAKNKDDDNQAWSGECSNDRADAAATVAVTRCG